MSGRRRRPDGRFYEPGDPDAPRCDWPNCAKEGLYRAPKDRDHLRDYFWFCLDHVREYNAAWNYYAGMNERQMESELRRDTIWNRPTWRWGTGPSVRHADDPERLGDPFGLFRESADRDAREIDYPRRGSPEETALRELDLTPPLTFETLRARYMILVKRHHPDANPGSKDSEERFKRINIAYHTLVNTLQT